MQRRKDAKTRRHGLFRLIFLPKSLIWGRGLWILPMFFALLAASAYALTITQAEYFLDTDPGAGNGTAFTFTGTDSVGAVFSAPGAGALLPGVHKLYTRYRDSEGVWSPATGRYYFIFTPWTSNPESRAISQMEYYFDNLPPTVVDVPDSGYVALAFPVSTQGLDFGVHKFFVRYRDDHNALSGAKGRFGYIVSPPPTPFVENHLVGGEYWVDTDPGVGNGVPFGPADDGAWDEGDESATVHLTGLPLGTHYLGIRFRDEGGLWSPTIQDTMAVGPVLSIHRVGNSLVLDWIPSSETAGRPFHVWRALQPAGPFAEVDTTSSTTWTDVDILNSPDRHFYHVRQTLNSAP